MMKIRVRPFHSIAITTALVCGCGGNDMSGDTTHAGSGTAYGFVTPTVGTIRTYSETVVDNSNNTILFSMTDTIEAVNSDDTVSQTVESTGGTDPVNGTIYTVPLENQNFNAVGQETSYSYANSAGTTISCTLDPHGSGPNFPVQVGETWTSDYSLTCGSNAAVSYAQSGTVVDVESITVPAGTYTAIKFISTLTWTDSQGTTRTESITNWRDVATSYSVKESISIDYSGTLPSDGYAVSRDIVLQSISAGS